MRGETTVLPISAMLHKDFNPLSPCGERRQVFYWSYKGGNFNPLSPCGERPGKQNERHPMKSFQSTLPMRGETVTTYWEIISLLFQSTLPMRGETGYFRWAHCGWNNFNPLSPCGERLVYRPKERPADTDFNPLSPCGERHILFYLLQHNYCISIHSPHAGRDFLSIFIKIDGKDFNPLSPCGERR